jgi:hypothetical protein
VNHLAIEAEVKKLRVQQLKIQLGRIFFALRSSIPCHDRANQLQKELGKELIKTT